MINKQSFGSFIREKRTQKGLTQKELAEILFLSESAISKWEMGKSYPDITVIPDICRALDVSERELINGANDTEYRRMKEEARLYRKISETFFFGFTAAYVAAFVISFICDLCINHRPTFSVTVLAALTVAFTFLPTCVRFTKKHKLAVFVGSTLLSLTLLYLVCCGKYFAIAAAGTLLGYVCVFGFPLLKKYVSPKYGRFLPLLLFAAFCVCLFLLLCVVRLTVEYRFLTGIYIAAFAVIPPAVIAVMHLVRCSALLRASADVFVSGAVMYGAQYCVNALLGIDARADYRVDFTDWTSCVNGNVYLLLLLVCLTVSAALLVMGIVRHIRNGKS